MKSALITTKPSAQFSFSSPFRALIPLSSINFITIRSSTSQSTLPPRHFTNFCISTPSVSSDSALTSSGRGSGSLFQWSMGVGKPSVCVPYMARISLSDQAFFLLAFIACTTSVAFTSFVVAAVPTLHAMGRTATSLSKLSDTAREELPSTMAAIRLSGMEISDLTLELSDLSQEIADGVNKSTKAVQAAEAGIRKIGSLARQQTISMIQERANLPIISLQPVVTGAAKKTSRAVGQATRSFINMISQGEFCSENEEDSGIDRDEV